MEAPTSGAPNDGPNSPHASRGDANIPSAAPNKDTQRNTDRGAGTAHNSRLAAEEAVAEGHRPCAAEDSHRGLLRRPWSARLQERPPRLGHNRAFS
jgi:hypothetical protein